MFVYRDKEPPSGNVLIVDIDGVLADASAHQHFLNGETQNWEAFFKALIDIKVFWELNGEILLEKKGKFLKILWFKIFSVLLLDPIVKIFNFLLLIIVYDKFSLANSLCLGISLLLSLILSINQSYNSLCTSNSKVQNECDTPSI